MFMRRFDFELAPGKPEVGMTTGTGVGARSGEYEIRATSVAVVEHVSPCVGM
jgi:hypothetical protein